MPDDKSTGVVELDQYEKDKDEFDKATDAILSADPELSDEELNKKLDEDLGPEADTAGEATKDQSDTSDESDNDADETDQDADQGATSDTGKPAESDTTDWKAKADELEAELKKERQKTSSWDGRIKAANKRADDAEARVKELEAKVETTPDPDAVDEQKVLEGFRNDFPEMADVLDILQKKIDRVKPTPQAKSRSEDVDTEGDSGESTATDEVSHTNTHLDTINEVHPDLSEMVNTGVLLTWIKKQASYIKPTLENIYYNGSAKEVIDMCSNFKEETGWKSQLDNKAGETKAEKAKRLAAMTEVTSESGGAPTDGPDKNDFDGAAKEAFSEK